MMHIRVDDEEENSKARFACGVGPKLPEGDKYVYESEIFLHRLVDCPGCRTGSEERGTPLSELSGRPGHPGFSEFCRIAASWGYD